MVVMVCLASFVLASEWPYVPGMKVNVGTGDVRTDHATVQSPIVNEPVWKSLERMVLADRQNSQISIELEADASQQALDMARRIENLWNNGKFNEALSLFPELAKITNANEMAIGNAWRVPVPTQAQGNWWGNDVRIGNRDSVLINALDIHRASGNLFAILLLSGDGNTNRWDVYLSTNGGLTWAETYDWWANYPLTAMGATIVQSHCLVGYQGNSTLTDMRLRRFLTSNGQPSNFQGNQPYVTAFNTATNDSVKEIVLFSNQDEYNNRIYFTVLTRSGNSRFFWDDTSCMSFVEMTTGVNYANHGLDWCWNEAAATYPVLTIYTSNRDSIHIDGFNTSGTYAKLIQYPVGTFNDYNAISAWRDTILTAFDFRGPVAGHVRYLTNYTAGSGTWYFGNIGGDTTTISESPDVALREGGGCGVVYRYYTSTRSERYTWRRYAGGWTTPVSVADYEPYYDKPSIEYLGSNRYGVVYTRWTGPNRACYFDRSDWYKIEEETANRLTQLGRLTPNPSSKFARLTYVVKNNGPVKISLYDASGRLVSNLVNMQKNAGEHTLRLNTQNLPAGIYFVHLETPDGSSSTPMTIIK